MKEITVRCRWESVDTLDDADECWLEQVHGPPGGSLMDWERL